MVRRLRSLPWLAIGGAGNALAGAVACRGQSTADARLACWLRATGNGTFVAYAAPFALRAGRGGRRDWWLYVGSHTVHGAGLMVAAARHRGNAESFSAVSRYGGMAGYSTVAILAATAYAPGGRPAANRALRRLHRAGEHVLFGLYAFTIIHGYQAKGRSLKAYGPLGALWAAAAVRGAARWRRPRATTGASR
jgi:hypothetical protein